MAGRSWHRQRRGGFVIWQVSETSIARIVSLFHVKAQDPFPVLCMGRRIWITATSLRLFVLVRFTDVVDSPSQMIQPPELLRDSDQVNGRRTQLTTDLTLGVT